jgi:hypothetical protein
MRLKHCPDCDRTYGAREDFCQVDGARLISRDEQIAFADAKNGFGGSQYARLDHGSDDTSIETPLGSAFGSDPDDVFSSAPPRTRHDIFPKTAVVGVLLVLIIVAVTGTLFTVRTAREFHLHVRFKKGAHGLKVGDNVYVYGRLSGEVIGIKLKSPTECLVTTRVQPDAAILLRQGTWFYVELENIMGKKRLNTLESKDPDAPVLESGQVVQGEDSYMKVQAEILKRKGKGLWEEYW